jgi:hypothetical protein
MDSNAPRLSEGAPDYPDRGTTINLTNDNPKQAAPKKAAPSHSVSMPKVQGRGRGGGRKVLLQCVWNAWEATATLVAIQT